MANFLQDLGRFREPTALRSILFISHNTDACGVEVRHRKPRTAQDKRKDGGSRKSVSGLG